MTISEFVESIMSEQVNIKCGKILDVNVDISEIINEEELTEALDAANYNWESEATLDIQREIKYFLKNQVEDSLETDLIVTLL